MEVYNIGAPQNNFSADELATLISDTLQFPIIKEYKEIQADSRTDYEIDQRIPDIKKVKKISLKVLPLLRILRYKVIDI